jgi:hypothetical protein
MPSHVSGMQLQQEDTEGNDTAEVCMKHAGKHVQLMVSWGMVSLGCAHCTQIRPELASRVLLHLVKCLWNQ